MGYVVSFKHNRTGYVTVIVDLSVPDKDNNITLEKPVKPVAKEKTGLAKYETGYPIIVLLMVLALLGVNIKRRK